jgi:Predicted transcriptional regulator
MTDRDAVTSAAAKLRAIMGESTAAVFDARIDPADVSGEDKLAIIHEGMQSSLVISFRYASARSDTTTLRAVVPARIFINEGETYLTGWEEAAGGHRTYRLDRIQDVHLEGRAGDAHLDQLEFDANDPFNVAKQSEAAECLLRDDATWLADYVTMGIDGDSGADIHGDGRTWFRAVVPLLSKDWFLRFAVSHIDVLTVTGPDDLVTMLRGKARRGVEAYHRHVQWD